MIAIVDYGVGNLFSLVSSLSKIGYPAQVSGDSTVLRSADRLILPGVGAFRDAAEKLRISGLDDLIRERAAQGIPVLGICLGMQLLFDRSYEFGDHRGLGLIHGNIVPMKGRISRDLKIPHIGWNALHFPRKSDLFRYVNDGECVYFVHSFYAADCDESVIAAAEYGISITAAVNRGNVWGCQFHPEKSGCVGLNILKAFCEGVNP